MEKFSKYQKREDNKPLSNELFKGKTLSIVNYDGWEMTHESDMVIILPYMKDKKSLLLRSEYVPTYRYRHNKDNNKDHQQFLTCVCGTMENGETPEQTIRRELYEEAGIILSSVKSLDIEDGVHLSKGNLAKYYCCIIEIGNGEYKQTIAPGDGSKAETLSRTIEIPVKDIDELIPTDIATKYLLTNFKLKYKDE